MDQEIHLPTGAVVGAIVGVAASILGWIIKVAARQTLDGFKESLGLHTKALEALATNVELHRREMADLRVVQADFNARLKALERRDFNPFPPQDDDDEG